ncbi:hypothetical protein LCGC14_3169430 [marine sediment metagenome]|uniref:Uncharacterized protein n=1 Tax=marine sediment metagenome TaxID=412755 RepID=A0A0F8VET7_9ZZZZ
MAEWEPPENIRPFMVCAAIRRKSDGAIIAGPRHFDSIMQQAIKGHVVEAELNRTWADADQGFIDQWGRFHDRTEAAEFAFDAGQITDRLNLLYSEDLY